MTENRYAGMTVNERLLSAGLLDDFDNAANNRNRDEMINILLQVELSVSQAEETTDTIIEKPSKYDY